MPKVKHKNWTYSEYLDLDDEKKYEIHDGKLIEMSPAPSWKHQKLALRLAALIDDYSYENNLGSAFIAPCDVVLSEINVYQPDVFYISKDNLDILKEKDIQGAPDLVVEILSPSNENYERVEKYRVYEKFKIKEYWIIDQKRTSIEVYVLDNDKYIQSGIYTDEVNVVSQVLNGFILNYKELAKRILF